MKKKLFILVVLILLVVGGGYYYKNLTSGFKTFSHSELGIEFKYPDDGVLLDVDDTHARIQNYDISTKEYGGLLEGEYYMELNSSKGMNCGEYIREGESKDLNGHLVRIGKSIGGVSDAGGARLTLCADAGEMITLSVTEAGNSNELANKIFSTFKFIK